MSLAFLEGGSSFSCQEGASLRRISGSIRRPASSGLGLRVSGALPLLSLSQLRSAAACFRLQTEFTK